MAGPAPASLYGFAQEGDTYHHADLILCANPFTPGQKYLYTDLAESSFPGYSRITSPDLAAIYPDKDLIPGRVCRLTSRQLVFQNRGAIGVNVSGLALVIWSDPFNPIVVAVTPSAVSIPVGRSIRGRHVVTSSILDFVP